MVARQDEPKAFWQPSTMAVIATPQELSVAPSTAEVTRIHAQKAFQRAYGDEAAISRVSCGQGRAASHDPTRDQMLFLAYWQP